MSGDLKREIMYTVVRSKDLAEFERLVKWYLNSGWDCKGSMVVSPSYFYQPMTKVKNELPEQEALDDIFARSQSPCINCSKDGCTEVKADKPNDCPHCYGAGKFELREGAYTCKYCSGLGTI